MKRPRYFQWLDGELQNTVTTLVNITEMEGEYFYNFADGESCNVRFVAKMTNNPASLKDKFIVEIASPNDPWRSETIKVGTFRNAGTDELVEYPPLEDITGASGNGQNLNLEKSKLGKLKFTPPRFKGPFSELPSLDDYFYDEELERAKKEEERRAKQKSFGATMVSKRRNEVPVPAPVEEYHHTVPPTQAPVQQAQAYVPPSSNNTQRYEQPNSNDPVRILAKTSKKRPTDVDLTITINLPSKAIYDIAESEFEDGGKNFVNYLIEDIDVNGIISSLRDALQDAYSKTADDKNEQ